MSHVLLLATESLPSPTATPDFINFANGARPWPNFAFDFGQCATFARVLRNVSISASSTRMQCASNGRVSSMPTCFKYSIVETRGAFHSIERLRQPFSKYVHNLHAKTALQLPTRPRASSTANVRFAPAPRSARAEVRKPCTAHVVKRRHAQARSRLLEAHATFASSFSKFSANKFGSGPNDSW